MRPILALLLAGCAAHGPPVAGEDAWRPHPPPADDLVYFVMVDRFANGDPTNDGAVDPADPQAFHGGDLRGVLDRLDHLEALGVRTVWLSPVWEMRTGKFFQWGAFHGYWTEDPGRVEPRFGTAEDLRALSDALHARGMRLLLDVVWNHVAPDARLLAEHPDWFHGHGGVTDWDDPFQLVYHEVHGLPDLAQEHPEVAAWIRAHAVRWIHDARPDGYRVDAVRHMPLDFLAQMSADLRSEAGPGFLLLGEDFQGDPVGLARSFAGGGFGAMFDFPLHYAMRDVFCDGRPAGRLAATLSVDRVYPRPDRLVTFLDNHDTSRILTACGGDVDRVRRALAFQYAARGIPSLTWGTEAGLQGAGEPENRGDMVFDAGHPLEADLRVLAAFRRRHPALMGGDTRILAVGEGTVLLARVADGEVALVAVNPTGNAMVVPVPFPDAVPTEVLLAGGGLHVSTPHPFGTALVPPGSVWVATFAGSAPMASEDTPVALAVSASGAPVGEGSAVVLVGTGPELGNWDPARGLALPAEVTVPAGTVLEAKLVVRHPDGSVTWQPGENRYHLAAAPGPVEVEW